MTCLLSLHRRSSPLRFAALASLLLASLHAPVRAAQAPANFSTVIGHALLCMNQLDAGYFHTYLSKAFGPPYKRENGAWWFRAGTTLWNTPIAEIMVSDGTGEHTFIGAVADVKADQLATAIATAMGQHFVPLDASAFPVRESPAGATIVYFQQKSKVYCAKSQALLPTLRP